MVGKIIQALFPVEKYRIPATGRRNIRMTQTEKLILQLENLKIENAELKLLLKESIETFPTKRLADRIYKMPGIERPEPEPIPMKPGEEISF